MPGLHLRKAPEKGTAFLQGLQPAEQKQQLVDGAHQLCPYSDATRGNIDVQFEIL